MTHKRYLSAREAADILGITVSTVYSYVSRGLIRSESADESARTRRYYAEDVENLIQRKEAAQNPESLAESAMHWGTPSLDSEITLILNGNLYYRGWNVAQLVKNRAFEEVATLIWLGDSTQTSALFTQYRPSQSIEKIRFSPDTKLIQRLQSALPLLGADDLTAYDFSPENSTRTGARILSLMAHLLTHNTPPQSYNTGTIAEQLAASWVEDSNPAATDLINTALILCADHELNASSFTARVVASTGAPLYQVVTAGLAALQGIRHGGFTERVVSMLNRLSEQTPAKALLADRLKYGEIIPGFKHKLYPDGDPRALILLSHIKEHFGDLPLVQESLTLSHEYHQISGEYPTIDFALGLLELALKLPPSGGLAIFALGRTAGWIGHSIEQYRDGRLIRPRARYTGNQPH